LARRHLDGNQSTMNYRHAYHAGKFADVVKHAVLALLTKRLKQKEAAFRVIDAHARPGLRDLSSRGERLDRRIRAAHLYKTQ
jgi:23S rRNA A2030 N6-methylase RlmJ